MKRNPKKGKGNPKKGKGKECILKRNPIIKRTLRKGKGTLRKGKGKGIIMKRKPIMKRNPKKGKGKGNPKNGRGRRQRKEKERDCAPGGGGVPPPLRARHLLWRHSPGWCFQGIRRGLRRIYVYKITAGYTPRPTLK